ncbi:MAG: hypothetical protein H6807_16735, partial [Planctomycetes bacterium]|nr:hypothetical protein [Planctomycetota bacterium]
MNKVMIIVALLVVLTTTATAQSFAISGMWGSSPVVLNGQAATGNGVVRVAPALTSSKGSIFYNSMLSVENGFDTTFTFKITVPVGGAGADGMAFVIHGDPRGSGLLTNHAAALGYGAFATSPAGTGAFNALAIEIDTYSGSFNGYSDSGANEISVHTNGVNEISQGENHSIGRINLSTAVANFSDGLSHSLRVLYVP